MKANSLNLGEQKETKKEEPEKKKSVPQPEHSLDEIENLNVHQLRRLARSTEGFPIKGREISRANRPELIVYFQNLKK